MACPFEEPDPTADCRTRLVQAACAVFGEEGYRASIDRIAARAGVARQTLYNNFANKEELFCEVGQLMADSVALELCMGRDGLSHTLYKFGLDLRSKVLSDKGMAIYRSFMVEGARVPELASAIHGRVQTRLSELVSEYLAAAMKSGELRREDPKFGAEMFISMLIHIDRTKRLAGDPQLGTEEEQKRVKKIVTCFLRAFKPD